MGRIYINGAWISTPDECPAVTPVAPSPIPPIGGDETIILSAVPSSATPPELVLIAWNGAVNATNSDRIDILNPGGTVVLALGVFGIASGSFNFLTNGVTAGTYEAKYVRVISTGSGIGEVVKSTTTFEIIGAVSPIVYIEPIPTPPLPPPILIPPGGGWNPPFPPQPQPPPMPPVPPTSPVEVIKYLRAQLCQLTNISRRGNTFADQCGEQLNDLQGNKLLTVILVPLEEAQTIRKNYKTPPQEQDAINITFDYQDQCYWLYVHKYSTGEGLYPADYYTDGVIPTPVHIPPEINAQTGKTQRWSGVTLPRCNDCCKAYVKTTRCNHISDVIYFDRYSSKFDGNKILTKQVFSYIDTDLNIRDCYQLTDTFVRRSDIVLSSTASIGDASKINIFYGDCDHCLYYTAERCDGLVPSIYIKISALNVDPLTPELRNGIEYGGTCYWINRSLRLFPPVGSTMIDDISVLSFFGANLATKVAACAACLFPACICDAAAWAIWAPGGVEACADDLGWVRQYRIVGYNPAAVPFDAFNPACAASIGDPNWDGTFAFPDTQSFSGCGICNWLAAPALTSLTLGTVRNSTAGAAPCTSEINIKLLVSGWYLQVYCGDWGAPPPVDYLVWRGKKAAGKTPAGVYYRTTDVQSSAGPSSIAVEAY